MKEQNPTGKDDDASSKEDPTSPILEYVKAATSSSDRVRTVMIVMVTASVLALVGFRNSRPGGGWLDHRIAIRKDALRLFDPPPQSGQAVTAPAFDWNNPSLTTAEKERYRRAKQYLDDAKLDIKNPDDKQQVLEEVKELRKVRIDKIRLIQVPFFGAAFDMNDMGVFAGITFTIVLLWFRFSLSRQLSNFRLAFKQAKAEGQLKTCYELIAMQQVLTIPPMEDEKRRRIWVWIAKALFLIPVVILIELFRLNWVTRAFGGLLSVDLMRNLLIWNAAAMIACAVLTYQCLMLSRKADKLWRETAAEIYDAPETR